MTSNSSDLWKQFHTNALQYKLLTPDPFLHKFRNSIPRYTKSHCRCHEFWEQYIKKNPPTYGPNDEYFVWSVHAHNAVNTKLNKPLVTVEDAILLYSTNN